jgi:hypothetical protein
MTATQLQRIQELCDQVAAQIAQEYSNRRLTIYATVAPATDRESSAITVIVSTEDGGMEMPCDKGIPNESLQSITREHVEGIIRDCVRRFLNMD